MTNLLKSAILRFLERCGYVLLKKREFEHMMAAAMPPAATAAATRSSATPAAEPAKPTDAVTAAPSMVITIPPAATPPAEVAPPSPFPIPLPESAIKEFATGPDLHPDFERAFARLQGKVALPSNQAFALYSAVCYLTKAGISGDIVDCGEGRPDVLAVIGAFLVALGDTSRHLVSFDVTSDHRHWPDTRVPLWGTDYDLLAGARPRPQPKKRVLPEGLIASGYPAERISVAHHPADTIDLARPISFLGLTAETYDANRAAVRMLAPRVSIGGVIAVEGNEHTPRATIPGCVQHHVDAVAEFLKGHGANMPFWQATPAYRLGVKLRPFSAES
jgi:hypothetical protein